MADELQFDLEELDNDINNQNRVEKRIKDLSQSVKTTSEERDAERAKAQEAETARLAAEKERDFFKDFSAVSAKYPGASEYQDDIMKKVVETGYSLEDAAITTLAAQGKLNIAPPPPEREMAAGGSASNQLQAKSGSKSIGEMTQEERKSALMEAEKRGDISA